MWNLVTLDGFFEGAKPWDLDWHNEVWGEELEQFSLEQAQTADTLLFGRLTYQGMVAYWTNATGDIADFMNSVTKVVASRTLAKAEWNNTRLINTDIEAEVLTLKQQPGKNILIFGSANLCATLMPTGLIDEYRLCIVPVVLGNGTPLFKSLPELLKLNLLKTRTLKSGGIILYYISGGRH